MDIIRYVGFRPALAPLLFALLCLTRAGPAAAADPPPNVVLILADDLGYGDLGCYGQAKIKTPHLDRLAADGLRFTQFYAGSTVCAPSRCALLTGLHTGHAFVRGNKNLPRAGNLPLRPADVTLAELLQQRRYATAVVGKWGLGETGTTGAPAKKGFAHSFGYLDHRHAHDSYPDYLVRDGVREAVDNPRSQTSGVAAERKVFAPDLFRDDALAFLDAHQAEPFFLYYASTIPHANNERTRATGRGVEVPSDAPYTGENWPAVEKEKAALITRLDADVGRLLAKLADLKLDRRTVVLFTSDNGPHKEGGNDPAFFAAAGPFRGIKRSLGDGGIRVPCVVRWPGLVAPGRVSDHVCAAWDVLPSVCAAAGVAAPPGLDGVSFLPTLTGAGPQPTHEFLYWEFHEGGFNQAVRYGNWKAHRTGLDGPIRLYDVVADPAEARDVAAANPAIVAAVTEYLKTARTDSAEFPVGKK